MDERRHIQKRFRRMGLKVEPVVAEAGRRLLRGL
jgi:hypothetical protein